MLGTILAAASLTVTVAIITTATGIKMAVQAITGAQR
jgi:hypothetical protein